MTEVAEISGAALLFIQIAKGDIQSHGAIAHGGGVKLSGRHFEARIEIHRPFDDISFAAVPFYNGTVWFRPLMTWWFRARDRLRGN